MMTETEVRDCLIATGALLKGHFRLRSGRHSDRYFQAARVLCRARLAATLCGRLAESWRGVELDTVLAPAVGGIVVGQEVARHLDVKAIFAEKDPDSNLVLRRGFELAAGERVLVAEDVITRGGRVQQCLDLIRDAGAVPVGVAVLVDRSDPAPEFGVPVTSLLHLELSTYAESACPLCRGGVPLRKPGSA